MLETMPLAFDAAALDRLRRFGGEELLGEMIGLFIATAPMRVAAASQATTNADLPMTQSVLHALKSSAGQLGAVALQQLCERGEHLAARGAQAELRDVMPGIEAALREATDHLAEVRSRRDKGEV